MTAVACGLPAEEGSQTREEQSSQTTRGENVRDQQARPGSRRRRLDLLHFAVAGLRGVLAGTSIAIAARVACTHQKPLSEEVAVHGLGS